MAPADARFSRWAIAVIALGVLGAYANSFHGAMVLDDPGTIAGNPTIRSWSTALFPPQGGLPVSGRPVANLSFAVNYLWGGNRLAGYHLLNLAVHLACAGALFGIVRRLSSDWAGLAVAALWALHPLQTSAVTYLSQRAESLMGLFYLLTLYCFLRAAAPQGAPEPFLRRPWAWCSVLCCGLGMATKEAMVTAPLMVFLLDRTFIAPDAREAWRARKGYYALLALSWLVVGALAWNTGSRAGTAGFTSGVPWWAYALAQIGAVAHYLRLAVWPSPLIGDYGRILAGSPAQIGSEGIWLLLLAALSVVWLWRRSPWGFCGAWFFIILAPSSSVVPVATEIVAEHRMYLPLAAVVALAAGIVARLGRGWPVGFTRSALAVAAVMLGLGTFARNRAYGSVERFWSDVVAKVPGNAGAHNNLGNVLAARGDWTGAATEYQSALALVPDYADASGNLAGIALRQGRADAAIALFRSALRYRPDDAQWRGGLAQACLRAGEQAGSAGHLTEAAEFFGQASRSDPNWADPHAECGNVLAELGRSAEAAAEYRTALRLAPAMADVHNNLGGLLARQGRYPEAEKEFAEAVRLQPGYAEARRNLQKILRLEGKPVGP